ncbi:hypothetical protein QUF58_09845 [Anaerolineales bacterium HSG24]|nr:hypothetical protein [Anaerolineales bacterium HSG24]
MEAENSGQSKLFVILVVSLVGLLVLGLVGIGGVFVLRQNMAQIIAAHPTSTLIIKLPPAITPTPRVEYEPTNTPEPTSTNTPVIQSGNNVAPAAAGSLSDEADSQVTEADGSETANAGGGGGDVDAEAEPTPKPSPTSVEKDSSSQTTTEDSGGAEVTTAGTVPDTGLNAFQSIMLALGLVTVLLVARRLRTSL